MSDRLAVKRNADPRWDGGGNGGEGEEISSVLQSNRRYQAFGNNLEEIMRPQCMDSVPHFLEPFLRKVVREEVDKALSYYLKPSLKQIHAPRSRRWQLQFNKKLRTTLFAASKIEAHDHSPLQISIVDTFSNTTVSSGNLSSIKTEIVVLDGNFGGGKGQGGGDWTEKEFNDSLVREREGKRPLLTGDLCITLSEGNGQFGDVYFTDNSSWTRSRRFRLGLRVLTKGTQIKEAISEAFVVKDHRGELYKKHHPPSLGDEVWRLEKIGKDGVFHRKLAENRINTVQDFLKLLAVNQERLRSIFGNGMSNRMWEIIVRHVRECRVDNLPCFYYSVAEGQIYFNSILQVVGVKFDGGFYQQFGQLDAENQALVNRVKEDAYGNQNQMVEISMMSTYTPQSLLIEDVPRLHTPFLKQDGLTTKNTTTTTTTTKHFFKPRDDLLHSIQELGPVEQLVSSTSSFSTDGQFVRQMQEEYGTEASTSGWEGVCFDPFMVGNSGLKMLGRLPDSLDFDLGDGMFQVSGSEIHGHHPLHVTSFDSRLSPSKWVKLVAALKCGMLIRKRLAAKRRARIMQFSYQTCTNFPESLCNF